MKLVLQRTQEISKPELKDIIGSFLTMLQYKDDYTYHHSENVSRLAEVLSPSLQLSGTERDQLMIGSILHDVGKIGIKDDILSKPTGLTDSEYSEIKKHTNFGYHILNTSDYFNDISEIALYHHERWDGDGYPFGLSGDDIPYLARVVSVLDAYDAMTTDRAYSLALEKEAALTEIKEGMGKQFDPVISEIFIDTLAKRLKGPFSYSRNQILPDMSHTLV